MSFDYFSKRRVQYILEKLKDKLDLKADNSKITNYEDRGYLGKNLLKVTAKNIVLNGLTFTVNDDGSIKISGTATANTYFYPFGNVIPSYIVGKSVIVNGSASGVNIRIWHYDGTNTVQSENGNDSPTVTISTANCAIDVVIWNGTTVNTTIYPMLRLATGSTTYVPYVKSNIELDATKIDKTASEIQTSDGQFSTVTGGLMQSCLVDLELIQDLHGYSKPWTGGSGKNKLPLTVSGIKSANSGATWSGNSCTLNGVTWTINTDSDGNVISIKANGTASANSNLQIIAPNTTFDATGMTLNGCPSGGGTNYYIRIQKSDNTYISDTGNGVVVNSTIKAFWLAIAQGTTANNLVFKPMLRLSSVSDANFEPYTNICPISGHTQVQVGNVGKNLLNYDDSSSPYLDNCLISISDYVITFNATGSDAYVGKYDNPYASNYFGISSCKEGDIYKLVVSDNRFSKNYVTFFDANNTKVSASRVDLNNFTVPTGAVKMGFRIGNQDSVSGTTYTLTVMCVKSTETDPTFEPYNGYTTTINLGGTRYGGILDAVSGVLTVTGKFKEFDGTEAWNASGTNGFAITRTNAGIEDVLVAGTKQTPMDSNMFPNGSTINVWTDGYIGIDNGTIWIGDTNLAQFTDLATFKTFLSNNHLQIVYPLATPFTIQLTPTQLETLVGQNDVFAPLVGQTVEEVEFREVLAYQDIEFNEGLTLGETSTTAYRGDRGKTAYDHSQTTSGNPHNVTKSDVGLGNVPNVSTNDQTPTFTTSSTRANITSGEKLSAILGKISKFFTDLKAVAFTGAYSDLTGTPTIPTVNNGTLTITQNGTSKGTFTANQSGNATIALTDTTYSSKAAASGGTDVSLVTTGEKYTWNNKGNGTVTQVKVGTTAYNPSSGVISLPAYPTDTNTHRPIQMNGTEILGNNTTALNLKAGSNVSLSNSGGAVTINATNTDTKVTQTATTSGSDFEILFSETADNTTRTEGARKNSNLKFNPSTGNLQPTMVTLNSHGRMQYNATTASIDFSFV